MSCEYDMQRKQKHMKNRKLLLTGISQLDHMLNGVAPGDLVLIGSRPWQGKTTLALKIALNVALGISQEPNGVLIFSLEMNSEQLLRQIIMTCIPIDHEIMSGGVVSKELHGEIIQFVTNLGKAPLYIEDTKGLSIDGLESRVRWLGKQQPLRLVVIDYLQLLRTATSQNDLTFRLKQMAMLTKTSVLLLSHLRRPVANHEDAKPNLSQLPNMNLVEPNMDIICLLQECGTNDESQSSERLVSATILKNRNGGTGTINLNL